MELASNLVAVDRRQGVPNRFSLYLDAPSLESILKFFCIRNQYSRAKVVVSSKGKQTLKTGQIIASAILFQNDVKLLWQKMDEQGASKGKIMPGAKLKMKGKRRSLATVAASRLYAQVPLLSTARPV